MHSQDHRTPDASVAIPTRNRADSLARTLAALQASSIPEAMHVDILVVDKGSTDHTADVVAHARAHKSVAKFDAAIGAVSRLIYV